MNQIDNLTKVQIAQKRLQEILPQTEREWMLTDLLWEVNWALNLDDMLSLSTLRKAVALLPDGCVEGKAGKTIVHARHFARREEVIAALKALNLYDADVPVLIERHRQQLGATLYLATRWALHESLTWAAAGAYTISYTVYGTMLRWGCAA